MKEQCQLMAEHEFLEDGHDTDGVSWCHIPGCVGQGYTGHCPDRSGGEGPSAGGQDGG